MSAKVKTLEQELKWSDPVSVVSYNVLSPALTSGFHEDHYKKKHLASDARLRTILQMIADWTRNKSIVCLQEVAYSWSGPLYKLFSEAGYQMIFVPYGKGYSDYMGIALAFPMSEYRLIKSTIRNVAQSKKWPKAPDSKRMWILEMIDWALGWISWPLSSIYYKLFPRLTSDSDWERAKVRSNALIHAVLESDSSKARFCVASYHMPCDFKNPGVMVIHSALSMNLVQTLSWPYPYVFAGDFNFTPGSAPYGLYTTGQISPSHPENPTPLEHDPWRPTIKEAVRSVYAAFNGAEPLTTNRAYNFCGPFDGVLDYIWVSSAVRIISAMDLPVVNSKTGYLPNKSHPSDHLPIGGTFQFPIYNMKK